LNVIVARATVHLKKIAVKSQDVGKQISRNIVVQQNSAAMQQEIRFCLLWPSASLPVSTTLMEV
jgi:chemotaxis receptor (MCP) glutamine deamidase CheD